MPSARLHAREIQVINTLFSSDMPMKNLDIVIKNPGLCQSTVQVLLRKLLNKELVEVVGVVYSGNVPARIYRGTEKAKDEVLMHMVDEYHKISDVFTIGELTEAMLETETDIQSRIMLLKRLISMVS